MERSKSKASLRCEAGGVRVLNAGTLYLSFPVQKDTESHGHFKDGGKGTSLGYHTFLPCPLCHILIQDTVLHPPGLSASCAIKLFELTESNYAWHEGATARSLLPSGVHTHAQIWGGWRHGGPYAGLRSVPEEGGKRQAIAGSVRMPGISEQKVMSLFGQSCLTVFSSVCT